MSDQKAFLHTRIKAVYYLARIHRSLADLQVRTKYLCKAAEYEIARKEMQQ